MVIKYFHLSTNSIRDKRNFFYFSQIYRHFRLAKFMRRKIDKLFIFCECWMLISLDSEIIEIIYPSRHGYILDLYGYWL